MDEYFNISPAWIHIDSGSITMVMNEISWLVLATLATGIAVQLWLALRHIAYVRAHKAQVPAAFADVIPLDAHQKAADYTVAKTRLGITNSLFGAIVLLIWTFGGGLELLDQAWR